MGRYMITLHGCLCNSYDGHLKWVYYCAKKIQIRILFQIKKNSELEPF